MFSRRLVTPIDGFDELVPCRTGSATSRPPLALICIGNVVCEHDRDTADIDLDDLAATTACKAPKTRWWYGRRVG